MAKPVEVTFNVDKNSVFAALPKAAHAVQASMHGFQPDHGLASIQYEDGRLLYLQILKESDSSNTIIRFAPSVSYLGEKDESVIPEKKINTLSRQLRDEVLT